MPDTPTALPTVQGHCPACGATSLFLGDGGYVTCSRLECPEPDAASTLLERDPRRPDPEYEALKARYLEAVDHGDQPTILEPNPAREARTLVKTITREQLHDAIRTLARLDLKWWRHELRRYLIAQAVTPRSFLR